MHSIFGQARIKRLPLVDFSSDIAVAGKGRWTTRFNADDVRMPVVDDPILGPARKVIQMIIHEADGGGGATLSNPRGQLQAPTSIDEGTDFWVGFGILLPVGFPQIPLSFGWQSFFQLFGVSDTGYPAFRIAFEGNGGFFGWRRQPAKGGGDALSLTPQYGAWMDFALHVRSSPNPAFGFIEVYTNFGGGWTQQSLAAAPGDTLTGKRLYTETITPGLPPGGAYRTDIQNYRRREMYDLAVVYHADHRQHLSTGNDAADLAAVNPGSYPSL